MITVTFNLYLIVWLITVWYILGIIPPLIVAKMDEWYSETPRTMEHLEGIFVMPIMGPLNWIVFAMFLCYFIATEDIKEFFLRRRPLKDRQTTI